MALISFFRKPEHYGWLVVFSAALIIGMGLGSLFSISVFLKPLSLEFGWSRGDTAFAYTAAAMLNGLGGILMGFLADRYSTRPLVLFGGLMLGGALVLAGSITSLWQLYLIYGPIMGAMGLAAFISPLLANIGFWMKKNRGLAIGLVMGGQSLGGAVVPTVARYLISTHGWREAYIILGLTAWLIVLPLALLVREAPGAAQAKAQSRLASRKRATPRGQIDARKLTTVLCIGIVLCCICMVVPVVHLVALATDQGISARTAANIFAVLMFSSIFSRVGVGRLADIIGGAPSLLICSTIQTVIIFWFTQTHTLFGFYLLALLFGIGYGGVIPSYAIIIREKIPAHSVGGTTGLVFFFGNAGMGGGAYLGGLLYDLSGSYTLSYAAGMVAGVGNLMVIGTLLIYMNKKQRLCLA